MSEYPENYPCTLKTLFSGKSTLFTPQVLYFREFWGCVFRLFSLFTPQVLYFPEFWGCVFRLFSLFAPPDSLFPWFLGGVFRNLPAYFKNSSVSTFWYPPKLVGQAKISSAISFPRNSFVISFSFAVMSTSAKSSGYTVFAMYQVLARTIS